MGLEMAQQVMSFVTQSNDLSLIPETHTGVENWLMQMALWSQYTWCHVHTPAHIYMNIQMHKKH